MTSKEQDCTFTLRTARVDDLSLFDELNKLPAVHEFIGTASPTTDGCVWVIEVGGQLAGFVAIVPCDAMDGNMHQLVCALLPGARGRGFAERACAEALRVNRQGVEIVACVSSNNPDGQRLLERLGGVFLARRPYSSERVYSLRPPASSGKGPPSQS